MEKIYINRKVKNIINFGNKLILELDNKEKVILEDALKIFIILLSNKGTNLDDLVEKISLKYNIKEGDKKQLYENVYKYIYHSKHRILFVNDIERSREFSIEINKDNYRPIRLQFELTNNCNLYCKNCYKNANNKKNGKYLKLDKIKDILNEIPYQLEEIGITGGEPLLHPNFKEIVNYMRNHCFVLELNTNGLLLNSIEEELIQKFDRISISLYGKDNEEYLDLVGGVQGYSELKKSCDILTKLKRKFTLSVLLDKKKINSLEDYIKVAIELRATNLQFGTVNYIGRAYKYNSNLKLDEMDLKWLNNRIKEFSKQYREKIHILQWRKNFVSEFSRKEYLKLYDNICFLCSAGTLQWAISENGNFRPCVILPDIKKLSLTFEMWKEYINGRYKIDWEKYKNNLCEYCVKKEQNPKEYCEHIIFENLIQGVQEK